MVKAYHNLTLQTDSSRTVKLQSDLLDTVSSPSSSSLCHSHKLTSIDALLQNTAMHCHHSTLQLPSTLLSASIWHNGPYVLKCPKTWEETEESVAKRLLSLWTQHNILLETQKEGEGLSFLPLLPLLPVLAYRLKSCCGPAERVCKSNMLPVLFNSSLLDNLAFLLVKFTDDTKIDGVINTKDTLLLQNDADHWAQRPHWTKCILIEQIKANAPGN